jgi:hypothetical protein
VNIGLCEHLDWLVYKEFDTSLAHRNVGVNLFRVLQFEKTRMFFSQKDASALLKPVGYVMIIAILNCIRTMWFLIVVF